MRRNICLPVAALFFFLYISTLVFAESSQTGNNVCTSSDIIGFNAQYYLDNNADVEAAGFTLETAENHWENNGIREGRRGSRYFDIHYYLENYSDLKSEFANDYHAAYAHFLNSGVHEGRQGSEDFDVSSYVERYPDIKAAFGSDYQAAYLHWIRNGACEGRQGAPEDGKGHAYEWNLAQNGGGEEQNNVNDNGSGGGITTSWQTQTERFPVMIDQTGNDMAMDIEGNSLIIKETDNGGVRELVARRYMSDGTPEGDLFTLKTDILEKWANPKIAMNPDTGEYVVIWFGGYQETVNHPGGSPIIKYTVVYGQRYSSGDIPSGDPFRISVAEDSLTDMKIAMDTQGNFLVVWDCDFGDHMGIIRARKFNGGGVALSDVIIVAEDRIPFDSKSLQLADVEMDSDGGWGVVYMDVLENDGDIHPQPPLPVREYNIYFLRYDTGFIPLGPPEKLLFLSSRSILTGMNIGMDKEGGFAAVWRSGLSDYSLKRFDRYGRARTEEVKMTYTGDVSSIGSHTPSIATDEAGNFIIGYVSNASTGYDGGIHAQAFNSALQPLGEEMAIGYPDAYTISKMMMNKNREFMIMAASSRQYSEGNYTQEYYLTKGRLSVFNTDPDDGPGDGCYPSSIIGFNAQFYLNDRPDLKAAGYTLENVKDHWEQYGIHEGRQGSKYFDVRYYLEHYSDLRRIFGSNYQGAYTHYLDYGVSEGRQGSDAFDVSSYVERYTDLKNAFGQDFRSAYQHWIEYGACEGRQGVPDDGQGHAAQWNE